MLSSKGTRLNSRSETERQHNTQHNLESITTSIATTHEYRLGTLFRIPLHAL